MMHGGAVSINDNAILFLGESGQGKSTLSASFAAGGCAVLTDDCFLLKESENRISCVGSYPGIRLWPDTLAVLRVRADDLSLYGTASYNQKRRLCPNNKHIRFAVQPVYVRNAYVLGTSHCETVSIKRLSAHEAVVSLVEHSFRLDITDRERNAREFDTLTRLAEKLPMYRLSYPRRYEMLPAVREAILAHLQETG